MWIISEYIVLGFFMGFFKGLYRMFFFIITPLEAFRNKENCFDNSTEMFFLFLFLFFFLL